MVDNAPSSFFNNSNPTPTTLANLLTLVNQAIASAATASAAATAAAASAAAAAAVVGTSLLIANNLSDVASVSLSRTHLGLGGAAVLNVGTITGTVAAGDDSRITGAAQKASNLSDLANTTTALTNLGGLAKASNLSDVASVTTSRTNLGLGTAATQASTFFAQVANNLSDLASAPTARTNLGLGTAATFASTAFLPATSLVGFLGGLGTSWVSTTSFSVATGNALSDDNSTLIILGSALTKTTGAWVAGTGNGGIDTGAIAASTWYHIWVIENTTGPVIDVLFSLSPTAPTMPTGYTKKRRIGSVKTDGSSHFIQYTQDGDTFSWTASPLDVNTAVLGTGVTTFTLASIPTGVAINALLVLAASCATANNTSVATTVGATIVLISNTAANFAACGSVVPITNTLAQIKAFSNTASTTLQILTGGWIDRRGRG